MFAHCLLPALLLLATGTVDYCMSEEVPPYLTSKSAGDLNLGGYIYRSIKFEIPSGVLNAQYNPAEACPANSHLVKVAVKVWDYRAVRVYVRRGPRGRSVVEVTRPPPALGAAAVRLDVACSY